MSLGDNRASSSNSFLGGSLEKFPIICSLCKLEKTVPFKPEPGRAAYCKECIAKIKSGEVKVEKKGKDQIAYDESKFFKPLADLGIEFEQKKEQGIRRIPISIPSPAPIRKPSFVPLNPPIPIAKPSILSNIKKVFTKSIPIKGTGNSALKELLDKTLTPAPTPISLDSLKEKTKEINKNIPSPSKDRAASTKEMNKLKDLISSVPQKSVKEVPEDVLKKILE